MIGNELENLTRRKSAIRLIRMRVKQPLSFMKICRELLQISIP